MEAIEITEILCNPIEPSCEENIRYLKSFFLKKKSFCLGSSNQQRSFAFLDNDN